MFIACGSFNYKAALYHLVTHAYSKALLFLVAGLVIHFFSGEQDIRRMGSCSTFLPYLYVLFLFGSFSLIGFPFTSGFYSKEMIINEFLVSNTTFSTNFFCLVFLFSSTLLTSIYSFRLIYHVFVKPYSGYYTILAKSRGDLPHYLSFSLLGLFVVSFLVGDVLHSYFINENLFFLSSLSSPYG